MLKVKSKDLQVKFVNHVYKFNKSDEKSEVEAKSKTLQFSPLGELYPELWVGWLVGYHFSQRTALTIFLIFCMKLDIDK